MQPPTLEIHFHMCIYSPSVPVCQLSSFYIQREEEKSHRVDFFCFQALPYKGSILKGLIPGQHITIKGQISMYPHR